MNILESATVFMEKVMSDRRKAVTLGMIAIIPPLVFLSTVYDCWFGAPEIIAGFKTQKASFGVMNIVNVITLFTTLPARKSGRVIQIVMSMWAIELFVLNLALYVL